ncbi:uncharacterized protein L203_104284 [Cryptococcus depauperatus CBS 7841]|uniref:Cytochrome c oxidase assembly protein subunit 15 n=1 Tax=Cryptococcus depauperatus CBS 7841 TaxID=1295531 RepID=A0AAJ8M2E3_9TREE
MFVAALRYTTRRLGVQPVGPHRVLSTASFAMRPSVGPTRLPYFTPCTTFFYPSHSFTLPRTLSTSSSNQAAYSDIPKSLPVWLYGCSAVVFGIVVVGGLTRLTESGLSIVEWNPITGVVPPMTDAAWDAEWENFVVPTLYYLLRYKLPRPLPTKLFFIGLGIGFQGVLGWWMVKSGLDERILKDGSVPRVSQYRLAAHYSAAVALYLGMLSTAIGIQRDRTLVENASSVRQLNHPAVKRFRGLVHLSGMLVALTAVTGAFVAGLDAGLVYNEFPFMGDGIVPPKDELFDDRYARTGTDKWWRNLLENPVTAQFDHRLLATTTFAVLSTLPFAARNLPIKAARRLAAVTTAAAVVQVSLGISTLLYLVPIPLAAMHQAGSVVLLTCIMALGGSLRKPSKMIRYLRRL